MNPREQSDSVFDKHADAQLRRLERALGSFDPDEAEADTSGDVLTITVLAGKGPRIIINRHRAARQIWMAAARKAWHFDPDESFTIWRTGDAELVATLEQVLSEQLKRPVSLAAARAAK